MKTKEKKPEDLQEKIIALAEELIKNTKLPVEKRAVINFLDDYKLHGEKTHFTNMLSIFSKIVEEDYDMTDYQMYEKPYLEVYAFAREGLGGWSGIFYFVVDKATKRTYPAYKDNENGDKTIKEASTIEEAIERFRGI